MEPIMIDVNSCAQLITDNVSQSASSLGALIAIASVGFVIFFILYIYTAKDLALMKDYLRRRNGLNDFENWKKDREVKV